MVSNLELLEWIRRGFIAMIRKNQAGTRKYAWATVQAYLFGLAIGNIAVYKPFLIEARAVKDKLTPIERAIIGDVQKLWQYPDYSSVIDLSKRLLVSTVHGVNEGILDRMKKNKAKKILVEKMERYVESGNERLVRTASCTLLYMAITEKRSGGKVYGWDWITEMRERCIEEIAKMNESKGIRHDIALWKLTKSPIYLERRDKLLDPRYWLCWVWG